MTMKRLFTTFLSAACICSMIACSDEETPVPQPEEPGSEEELPALPSEGRTCHVGKL